MNRTKIIEHYKKFHKLDSMQEEFEIDIDWMQAFIEDHELVNKNDLLQRVRLSLRLKIDDSDIERKAQQWYGNAPGELLKNTFKRGAVWYRDKLFGNEA